MGLCQDWHIPLFLPVLAAALGMAYALDGRVAAGLALVEQGVEQAVARGRPRLLAPLVAWLSEAYLLAGRLEEAHQRAAQALDLPASISNAATRPGRCGSWARARRARRPQRASPPPATTARPSPWPRNWACARSRPTATAASARCMPGPASGAGACRPGHRHRPVPRHGDDLLAPTSGGGAGAGGVGTGPEVADARRFQSKRRRAMLQ